MTIQGALETLAGAYLAFYLACASVGRADIPVKLNANLHANAMAHLSTGWGCPSLASKSACKDYIPTRYK